MGRGGHKGRAGRGGPSRNSLRRGSLQDTFASKGVLNGRQNNSPHSPAFSLKDEARNTEIHQPWSSDLKLRHAKVSFVNAGRLCPEELENPFQERGDSRKDTVVGGSKSEVSMARLSLEDRITDGEALQRRALSNGDALPTALGMNGETDGYVESGVRKDSFFVDVKGSQKPAGSGFPDPSLRRSNSSAHSDSSGEVILFSGRKQPTVKPESNSVGSFAPTHTLTSQSTMLRRSPKSANSFSALEATVVDDPPFSAVDEATSVQLTNSQRSHPTMKSHEQKFRYLEQLPDSRPRRQIKRSKCSQRQLEEDAILADYLENMEHGEEIGDLISDNEPFRRDPLDTDGEGGQDQSSENEYIRQRDGLYKDGDGWDSTDLHDLDDLSTSDDVQANVEAVLSKRTRPSGIQYLVIWEGYTADDAHWIPLMRLVTSSAAEQIRIYESELAEMDKVDLGIEDSDNSDKIKQKVAMDLQDELEDMKDEQDMLDRKRARMADEQLARLLSKQEELGLGSDELILFDGDEEGFTSWDNQASSLPLSVWNQKMVMKTKKTKPPKEVPSASVLAAMLERDPYSGFDVMEHDRPSLRKKPKGRRGQPPLELSDSELENTIQMAWENDRSKKKIRKQEREELRAEGQLGREGKIDMKAKYKEGMSWDEVKKEISEFLVSPKETLPLPPMNSHNRKRVHEIANKFNLKSKSIGGGTSRFPTLYKTSRTMEYDEDALSGIEAQLSSKRFINRPDKRAARGSTARAIANRRGRGGGFAGAGVSYRDGEVVGATAPEIAAGNRGRTMLEKMGWSTGTALGALNNKGIMQPVAHVVKTTKAGLG